MGDHAKFRDRSPHRPSRFSDGDKGIEKARSQQRVHPNMRVLNLPFEWSWMNLKDFLINKKIVDAADVARVDILEGANRGTGIVTLRGVGALNKVLSDRNDYIVDGRKLYFTELTDEKIDKRTLKKDNKINREEPPMSTPANYYGLNKAFLKSLNITPPIPNKAFVMNLNYKVTKEKLREIFSMAGVVHHIELLGHKNDGSHNGMAVIEFDHPVEVVQAISMFHKQKLYDRHIVVQVDKLSDQREFSLPEGLEGIGPGLGPSGVALRNVTYAIDKQMESKEKEIATKRDDEPFMNSNMNVSSNQNQTVWRSRNQIDQSFALQNQHPDVPIANVNPMGMGMNANQMGMNANPMGMNANPLGMNANPIGMNANTNVPMMGRNANDSWGQGSNDGNQDTMSVLMALQSQIQQQGLSLNDVPNLLAQLKAASMRPDDSNTGDRRENYDQPNQQRTSEMVTISNLPPGTSPDIIQAKMSEVAEVKYVDMTSARSAIIKFASIWDASKAIDRYNHTRVQGCLLEMNFY